LLRALRRSLICCVGASALILAFSATADAISKPIAIGSNNMGLPNQPAVAVDSSGNLYTVWQQPSGTTLDFCKLAVGATKCNPVPLEIPNPSSALFFDPPGVIVNGSNVYVFEEVDGAADKFTGLDEWISTNGGATFTQVPYAVSYNGVGDSVYDLPMPIVQLPGGNFGVGSYSAVHNPMFEANSLLSAPTQYSEATAPNPFATITPPGNTYQVPNLAGVMASQLTGTMGILGAYSILEEGPCPSSDGLVYTFASLPASDAQLDTSTGPGSPWAPLGLVTCNADDPTVTSGPAGLGLLDTDDASLSAEFAQFRQFHPPATWGAPSTVIKEPAEQPTLSQDGHGAMYATFVNDNGVQLMYSSDGGSKWSGPAKLFPPKNDSVPDAIASGVGTGGQGWAVYAFGGVEYAQPFSKNDALPPAISHLKVRPGKFKPESSGGSIVSKLKKHRGAKISYADTQAAKTTFQVIERTRGYRLGHGACKALPSKGHPPKHSHRCARSVSIGSFSHQDVVGANSFDFSGRVKGRKLRNGNYRLKATPKFGGLTGKTASTGFATR
jgi:hypothetical protein